MTKDSASPWLRGQCRNYPGMSVFECKLEDGRPLLPAALSKKSLIAAPASYADPLIVFRGLVVVFCRANKNDEH